MKKYFEEIVFFKNTLLLLKEKLIEDKQTYLLQDDKDLCANLMEQADDKILLCNKCFEMLEKIENEEKQA